jgi:hypothetical protein
MGQSVIVKAPVLPQGGWFKCPPHQVLIGTTANSGICIQVNYTDLAGVNPGGSGGSGGSSPPYISSLVAGPDSTKTIRGATHGFATTALLVAVYDNASPRNALAIGWTVDAATHDVTITFGTPQSNYYVVINGGVGPQGSAGATGATGQGVPTGGATGQVLSKIDGTDYHTQWINQTAGTGGGAGMAAQLGDFSVVWTSATVLTVGTNCSTAVPCNVRLGAVVYAFETAVTITLSGGGTGTLYLYVDASGALVAGHNLTLTCSGVCAAVSGITGFPQDSVPLWVWTATSGTWDSSSGGVDQRAFLSRTNLQAGAGISITEVGPYSQIASIGTGQATNGTNGQGLTSDGSGGYGTPVTLGGAALLNIGTAAGTAAAGDDARMTNARTPTGHASSHQNGGVDEVATATPASNAIPKAGPSGALASGWIPALNYQTPIVGAPGNWPALGTAAALNYGTAAGNVVRLDASTGQLPAVDGSLLTNLPGGITANQKLHPVNMFFDGGGLALAGTMTRCSNLPVAGAINEFSAEGSAAGAATLTFKTVATTSYTGPASAATTIGTESLSSAAQLIDTTLSGWTTAIAANTSLCVTLSSPSTFTWLSVNLTLVAN